MPGLDFQAGTRRAQSEVDLAKPCSASAASTGTKRFGCQDLNRKSSIASLNASLGSAESRPEGDDDGAPGCEWKYQWFGRRRGRPLGAERGLRADVVSGWWQRRLYRAAPGELSARSRFARPLLAGLLRGDGRRRPRGCDGGARASLETAWLA